jgi:hypothetical protein
MAQPPSSDLVPVTPEAFLADRQKFWLSFGHFVLAMVIFLIILLGLMGIFLV